MIKKINYNYIKGDNTTIIFLHGWGMDKSAFDGLVHFFYDKYSVLTLDFLGFGKSDNVDDYYDTYEYAYQIFLLLKELNINKVILVGHSFGGRISILLSSIFDIDVGGLILTSSAGLIKFNIGNKLKILAYKLIKKLNDIGVVKNVKLNKFGSDDYKKLDGVMRKVFVRVVNQDLMYLLHRITAKTYLVWDRKDKITPYWICKKLHQNITASQIKLFDHGGHYACFYNKNKFIKIISNIQISDNNYMKNKL